MSPRRTRDPGHALPTSGVATVLVAAAGTWGVSLAVAWVLFRIPFTRRLVSLSA